MATPKNKGQADREKAIVDAAHLLNQLRLSSMERGEDLSPRDEETFWKFMRILRPKDRASVIN